MVDGSFEALMRTCTLGFMLLAAGGSKLLAFRLSVAWRMLAAAVPTLAISVAYGVFMEDTSSAAALGLIVIATLGFSEFLGWSVVRPTLERLASTLSSTSVTTSGVALLGCATIFGGIVYDDLIKEQRADADMHEMSAGFFSPPLQIAARSDVQTDAGTAVELRIPTEEALRMDVSESESKYLSNSKFKEMLIRRGSADVHCNCHGWVYAAGQFWVEGRWVPIILQENGYAPVDQPLPGDLIVYYDGETQVAHSGIVRYAADNQSPMIESKWGAIGVFLHDVKACPYGTTYKYYRSSRQSHVLKGIQTQTASNSTMMTP